MLVCCASAENMDASRFIGLAFVTLSLVLLSNQMALNSDDTDIICPLVDNPTTVNETIVHNITRTSKCVNGRRMAGCCVSRFYCDFNTSHIDLTLYGPPGFRMPCSDVCCPRKYVLPIPLPNLSNTTDSTKDHDQKNSMDASVDTVDSDSDENE